ncbi:MAG TPA: permease-like cell division protein FtsX [Ferruginibacter sp.]|nr:permease-like cell division protein FtsX [Ferruginibacter sp.]
MAQFGKASSKRGKPTYAYAIIGVALVLFLFGIIGWFFLNLRKSGDYFKENIQVHAYVFSDAAKNKKKIDSLTNYISSLPYARDVHFVNKEMAAKTWNTDEDSSWKKILDYNPLPESVDFYVKANYVQKDSLNVLSNSLTTNFPDVVQQVKFPVETVSKISQYVKTVAMILFIVTIVLTILVVFSIDNTIRLAMYSNRFLIKTMQMVGATRWFIAKPVNVRAIINGLLASVIAIAAIWGFILILENLAPPEFRKLHDTRSMLLLFFVIIVLGIGITLVSTHRSVIKYLRMKLDDLY